MSKNGRRSRSPSSEGNLAATLERQAPFSSEAEMAVLGSMMLLPDAIDDVTTILRGEDFFDQAHGLLFDHLVEMHNNGKRIDITLLRERLRDAGQYDQVGGGAYLARVFTSVPNAAHANYYARIVEEKSTLRQLIAACTDVLQSAYDPEDDADNLLSAAEEKVFAIREQRYSNALTTAEDVLHIAIDRMDARMRGDNVEGAVETGFAELDRITGGGLRESELIILAARPGMGKTALAMNIADHVVRALNGPVLFVSLEMSSIELIERLLCSVAKVNSHKLRNGTINQSQRKELIQRASELSRVPLYIDDSPSKSIAEIAATARRVKRRNGSLSMLVVDYLQLVEPDNSSDPRQEQVAKIARRLKGLARELRIPVLCISQLNRQAEESREHRPRLSHLRESGAIEQDADMVMFVHRDAYYLSGEEREEVAGEALLLVEKQRNGPTGEIPLTWIRQYTRFEDRAPTRHEEFDDFANVGFDVGS